MMGFQGGGCAVWQAAFGQGPVSSPVWLDNVLCTGEEDCLGECSFTGLDVESDGLCSHENDAGVICLAGEYDIVLLLSQFEYT